MMQNAGVDGFVEVNGEIICVTAKQGRFGITLKMRPMDVPGGQILGDFLEYESNYLKAHPDYFLVQKLKKKQSVTIPLPPAPEE